MSSSTPLTDRYGSLLSFLPTELLPILPEASSPPLRLSYYSPPKHLSHSPQLKPSRPFRRPKPKVASLSLSAVPQSIPPLEHRGQISDSEKIKLKNHHQLMRTMVKLEDETDEMKKSSILNQSFFRMSKGLRDIRTTVTSKLPKIAPLRSMPVTDFALRPKEAYVVLGEADRSNWMKHRGVEAASLGIRSLQHFVKSLFEVFDEEGIGSIELSRFVEAMLSLGACPDADWLKRALETLGIAHGKVFEGEFLSVIRKDVRYFAFFRVIESESTSLSFQAIQKQGIKVAHHISTHSAAESMLRSTQTFSSSCLTMKKIGGCLAILEQWWQQLNAYKLGLAQVSKVSELFVQKQLVGNKHEGRILLESVKPLKEGSVVTYDHFVRVFAPAIFFGALITLETELNSGEFEGSTIPFKVKVATFQRKLLLMGVVYHTTDKRTSPGKALVDALVSYRNESQTDGRTSNADSIRMSHDGAESLDLSQLDDNPLLGGENSKAVRRKLEMEKARAKSVVRTASGSGTGEAQKQFIRGKVYFPSVRKQPRPRDIQVPRDNFILEKYELALDLQTAGEGLIASEKLQ